MDKNEVVDEICRQYRYILYLARISGIDENDVEDFANDVLLTAVRAAGNLKDTARLKSWIRTISDNKRKRYFKKTRKLREISYTELMESGEETDIYDIIADEKSVEQMFQEAEDMRIVKAAISNLTGLGRAVVNMRLIEDRKFSEIADMIGVNKNTVKSIYRRSLEKLRRDYIALSGTEREDE